MFPKWLAMHNERAKFFAGFNCSTLTYFETRTSSAYLRPVLFSNPDFGVCGQLHVIPLVFLNSHLSYAGIQLAEICSLPYTVHKIDISKNTQKEEWVSLICLLLDRSRLTRDSSWKLTPMDEFLRSQIPSLMARLSTSSSLEVLWNILSTATIRITRSASPRAHANGTQ